MDTENKLSKIHPLLAGAAIAVIIACLVGIAAMMGVLPNFHKTTEPVAVTSTIKPNEAAQAPAAPESPPPVASETPAPATLTQQYLPAERPVTKTPTPVYSDNQYRQAPPVCSNCGEVVSVRAVQHHGPTTGVGAVGGAVVGGLIGNQFGGGNGRTLTTIAGAVGGGYVGNNIEKNARTTTSFEVIVRMDNGKTRRFNMGADRWRRGDLVRVRNGSLIAR
jgi:outer membrane lipoprotein SlyB